MHFQQSQVSVSPPEQDAPEETINQVLREIKGKGVAQDQYDIPRTTPSVQEFEERQHLSSPSQFETRPRSQGESINSLNSILDLLTKQQERLSVLQLQVEFVDAKFDGLADEVKQMKDVSSMAPRRRPREGVAEQVTRQEVGDALPPQQMQPLPQDAHSGIAPPPPPPQVAQGLDMTRFREGMAQFVAQHRDAPVAQGGTGKVLREFLQFQPPQFLGQPDPDAPRAWLDAVERTFHSMECVPKERRDSTVVQYRARFVELGRYAPQIMGDEGLRTQQFVRGLRPELRQALIVARVTDLDAAYQTAAALEADTLRTRARSAEVQTQVVPSQPRQQQGSVQTTPRTATSYASTSTGKTAKSGSRRKFRRDRRQAEQRQQSVGSVQQPTGQPSKQRHSSGESTWEREDEMRSFRTSLDKRHDECRLPHIGGNRYGR
ncbi:hypothetical protein Taro_016408 [Colocasia esculenta]|uniref:Gag protein n=1 Tax=Colocasia esculenta TaxID=4460 RepID=A0A843UKL6_COLES|nr:hypothetical protein [Colocasia esculenta]